MQISLISQALAGHRREYELLFQRIIEHAGATTQVFRDWKTPLFAKDPVFFLMIEDQFNGYLISALARSLLGRRTVGLLFRGRQALQARKGRRAARRIALQIMKRLPMVQTLSITPFSDDEALATIADNWIYDPQLWDLVDRDIPFEETLLSAQVSDRADGRKIVIALGYQTASKGFQEFARLWTDDLEIRRNFLLVSAGGVSPALKADAHRMEEAGAIVVDRFITDDELLSLYGVATLIWACYAPNYDQSSGIFGRALQMGVPAIIRSHSQISRRARQARHPILELDWDRQMEWASCLGLYKGGAAAANVALELKTLSVRAVCASLGLNTREPQTAPAAASESS